jgi:hypothetical protein
VVDGPVYTIYADGSVEAYHPDGNSIAELRAYIEGTRSPPHPAGQDGGGGLTSASRHTQDC